MPQKPESRLVADILRFMAELKASGVPVKGLKLHGNQYQEAGTPDLHFTVRGRSVWLEAKTATGRLTRLQEHRLAEWAAAGAVTGVVRSVEECRSILRANGLI